MDSLQCHLLFYLPPLFLALYAVTQHLLHKLLNLPPTPFPTLPLLGHIYFFFFFNTPLHRTLSQLSSRRGPLLFLRLGSRPVLLVSSPSAARECLVTNDVVFANRPNLLNGKHFGYGFTSLAWAPYGDHWRNLRRISTIGLLSFNKINSLSSVRADEARALIRKLLVVKDGDTIDMRKLLFEHTYGVVMGMIAGGSGAGRSEEAAVFQGIVAAMSAVTVEANVVDFLPFVGWFGFGGGVERKMRGVQEERERFMENVVERWHRRRREKAGGAAEERSLIRTLLELQREEPEYYSDQTIRNLLLVLLQGATHSSSNTLEWAFSLLLQNPQTLKTARSHIDNLVGERRLITDSDVSKIPYLRHVINETLRIHPPAPLLTPHLSSGDCTVGGSRIPRGTMLLVNAWDIQNNPRIWKDPEEFIPERFERVGDGMNIEVEDFKFLPFGWGRRGCPGEKLAMAMVGLALGTLIQCFEWDKVGEIDMREGRGVITPRAQPLRARCSPRPFLVNLVS